VHLKITLVTLLLAALGISPVSGAPLVVYAAGDIAECRGRPPENSDAARTARLIPPGATVLIPGDTAYPFGTAETYASCYEPTWGVHRPNTLAVPGNHDYVNGRSDDFRAYFGAGASEEGYFARRLGDWLVIGLDSQRTGEALDRQYEWLEATLRQNAQVRCTLALWHMPAFSSGLEHGSTPKMQRFWALLEQNGAEFVLSGHEHFYEAFDPLDAEGRPAADGMREFVVGTGGARLYPIWSPIHRSRMRLARHGVLKLTLDDGSYAWQFIDVAGRVRDAGEARCRPPAAPGQGP
jgi:3',5'-cyclic AMP phosphodiesterase CpdA